MKPTVLPPNSSALERRIEQSEPKPPSGLVLKLWNADTCPENMLPWLAWALSVDDWDPTWGVDRKRAACREARAIHQHKGTPAAVKRALAVRGHPDAILIERSDGGIPRDGSIAHDGSHHRGGAGDWATFRVKLMRPVTVDQAQAIQRMLEVVKRNCVHLTALDFTEALLRHNGVARRDGSYTRGVVPL